MTDHDATPPAENGQDWFEIQNIGPVPLLKFPRLKEGGLILFMGHNGAGKSEALDAIRAMQGDTDARRGLHARDGEARGVIEGGGIRLTIGGRSRTTGDPEVVCWEVAGDLDPSAFVDPGLKDARAADARRIEELIRLAGLSTVPEDWFDQCGGRDHVLEAVPPDEFADASPPAVAGKIKRHLEGKAREHESSADHAAGEVDALTKTLEGVNLDAPSDPADLQKAHTAAVRALAELEQQQEEHESGKHRVAAARAELDDLGGIRSEREIADEVDELDTSIASKNESIEEREIIIREAQATLSRMRVEREAMTERRAALIKERQAVRERAAERQAAEKAIDAGVPPAPHPDAVEDARADVATASEALSYGGVVREAKARAAAADQHRADLKRHTSAAEMLRDSARAVENVLTDIVSKAGVEGLSIEDGTLLFDYAPRGKKVPVAELSDGERWRIACHLVVRRLGAGAMIAVPQPALESLDPDAIEELHTIAREVGVNLYSARATRGPLRAEVYDPKTTDLIGGPADA